MRLKPSLTKDEMEWLRVVTYYGAELTRVLQDNPDEKTYGQFKGRKDWNRIQYELYLKILGGKQ